MSRGRPTGKKLRELEAENARLRKENDELWNARLRWDQEAERGQLVVLNDEEAAILYVSKLHSDRMTGGGCGCGSWFGETPPHAPKCLGGSLLRRLGGSEEIDRQRDAAHEEALREMKLKRLTTMIIPVGGDPFVGILGHGGAPEYGSIQGVAMRDPIVAGRALPRRPDEPVEGDFWRDPNGVMMLRVGSRDREWLHRGDETENSSPDE